MEQNQTELLYKIYGTTLSMLRKRGYQIDSQSVYTKASLPDRDNLVIVAELTEEYKHKLGDYSGRIVVFFPNDEKIGVKHIREYYNRMIDLQIQKAILVVKESITSFAKNEILSFANPSASLENPDPMPVNMEVFLDTFLMFDITEHELVPKHELLSDEEKEAVLKKYNLKPSQLPSIRTQDPISRFYDFKVNSLIKITRLSETGGISINYRIVV
jgi:DNA-directed RNA polymerase I, II, and III subunit RPABC1